MGFLAQHEKLRLQVKRRIDAKEFTITELAHRIQLSQPALSNFIHRRSAISNAVADRLLAVLHMDTASLQDHYSAFLETSGKVVPVVRHQAAMFVPLITPALAIRQSGISYTSLKHLPHSPNLDREHWTRFVAIEVTRAHADFMRPVLREKAVVVIDRHDRHIAFLYRNRRALYAVDHNGTLAIGHLEIFNDDLLLRPHSIEVPAYRIPLRTNRSTTQLVVGRICAGWLEF